MSLSFANPPKIFRGALVTRTSGQVIPNNALTTVLWQSEVYDTDEMFSVAVNAGRIYIPNIGPTLGAPFSGIMAQAKFSLTFPANGTGMRYANLSSTSGLGVIVLDQIQGSASTICVLHGITPWINILPGQYFWVEVYQNSGGPLTLNWTTETHFGVSIY